MQRKNNIALCCCNWRMASDDFVFNSWTEFLFRIIFAICITSVLIYEQLLHRAQTCDPITIYLSLSTAAFYLLALSSACLGVASMRDPIWAHRKIKESKSKRIVIFLLYVNIALFVLELLINVYGTIILVGIVTKRIDCSLQYGFYVMLLVNVFIWFVLTFKCLFSCILVSGFHSVFMNSVKDHNSFSGSTSCIISIAERFGVPKRKVDFYRRAGRILRSVFSDNEFVPSDVASALLLLNSIQTPPPENDENLCNLDPDIDLKQAEWFVKYTSAIYGPALEVYQNYWSGLRRIISNLRCCVHQQIELDQPLVEGDNCFQCNLASVKATLPHLFQPEAKRSNLIYVCFENNVGSTPFMVALDERYSRVVIAIRGTLSFHDAFTDLNANAAPIELNLTDDANLSHEFDCGDFFAHLGMMEAARYVYSKLNENDFLMRLLSENNDHSLLVTGHSLGAGTAVLLSFLLRQNGFQGVECLAYSCPGGVLSEAAALESEKFVKTFIVGDDLIPRLSIPNLAKLTQQMRRVLIACKLPKYKILARGICARLESPFSDFERLQLQASLLSNDDVEVNDAVFTFPMFVPGRIVHFVRCRPDPSIVDNDDSSFIAVMKTRSDFSEIIVSPKMFLDHISILRGLANSMSYNEIVDENCNV